MIHRITSKKPDDLAALHAVLAVVHDKYSLPADSGSNGQPGGIEVGVGTIPLMGQDFFSFRPKPAEFSSPTVYG